MISLDLGPVVAARIRLLRTGCGMTQTEAARRAGIHRPIWGRLERGLHVPSLDVLARVAGALGADLTDILAAVDDALGMSLAEAAE